MHNHLHHTNKKLGITIFFNLLITLFEALGGILSGSVALVSDAFHNFSDVLSLIISWIAKKIAQRQKTLSSTFGHKRAEIFASLINSVSLIILSFFLLIEAIKRLLTPVEVRADIVIIMAVTSIVLNALSVLLLGKEAKHSLNIRSAYLHLFSDMLTSIAVLIGGLIIKFWHIGYIDAVLSLAIVVYLVFSSIKVVKTSVQILMQYAPDELDVQVIIHKINSLEGIKNVHHIHIWQLDDKEIMFEAHVDVSDNFRISDFDVLQHKIKEILSEFGVNHYVIQPEWDINDSKNLLYI